MSAAEQKRLSRQISCPQPFTAASSRLALRSMLLLLAGISGVAAVQAQTVAPPVSRQENSSVARQTPTASAMSPAAQRNSSALLDAAFRRADLDGDGRLSRRETDHFPVLAERFEQIDRDGDQHLSLDEFQRAARD